MISLIDGLIIVVFSATVIYFIYFIIKDYNINSKKEAKDYIKEHLEVEE